MGKESSRTYQRRVAEGYFDKVFLGNGIDIGCGDDPITRNCRQWDLADGDAQELPSVSAAEFDWVYSSHCLEQVGDARRAIVCWWEVLKPGGKLLAVVPDEDLYEQGCWPSRFNGDHKWTFTVCKSESWSPKSLNCTEVVALPPNRKVHWIRTCDYGYDYSGGVWNRTASLAEAHIEMMVEKVA